MENECKKCGGRMESREDFLFDIEYYVCYKCGNVEFVNDGLGILRYSLSKEKRDNES